MPRVVQGPMHDVYLMSWLRSWLVWMSFVERRDCEGRFNENDFTSYRHMRQYIPIIQPLKLLWSRDLGITIGAVTRTWHLLGGDGRCKWLCPLVRADLLDGVELTSHYLGISALPMGSDEDISNSGRDIILIPGEDSTNTKTDDEMIKSGHNDFMQILFDERVIRRYNIRSKKDTTREQPELSHVASVF